MEMRKRVGGVDRQRREDRQDLAGVKLVEEPPLRLVQLVVAEDMNAVLGQGGANFAFPAIVLAGDEVFGSARDLIELLLRSHAVGRDVLRFEIVIQLRLQTSDAHLVELIEVRRRDRQESRRSSNGTVGSPASSRTRSLN